MTRGPGMRELSAEEHDQRRVVDLDEEHHHRARRTIGRADASPSQARETDYPCRLQPQPLSVYLTSFMPTKFSSHGRPANWTA